MFGIPTPATGYLMAAVFVAGLGIGGTATYKIERGSVIALELAISQANAQAQATLSKAKEKVAKAESDALQANNQLDKAHESAINSINAVHDQLAATVKRLLDNNDKASGTDPVSGRANPGEYSKDAANGTLFPKELTKFFRDFLPSEAMRADQTALDKNTLLDFVKNNCGIAQ